MSKKIVNIELAHTLQLAGMDAHEIAESLGVAYKTAVAYLSTYKQWHTEYDCEKCGKHIKKGYWFRKQILCEKCFIDAEPSKCEGLPDIKNDDLYHRNESIFCISSGTPRRTCGGAQ